MRQLEYIILYNQLLFNFHYIIIMISILFHHLLISKHYLNIFMCNNYRLSQKYNLLHFGCIFLSINYYMLSLYNCYIISWLVGILDDQFHILLLIHSFMLLLNTKYLLHSLMCIHVNFQHIH